MARDYRKIRAWQMADELALRVFRAGKSFPRTEVFGLTSLTRRAAVSVPANIVEGATRRHEREYVQFLYVALGSLAELGYYLSFSRRVGFLTDELHRDLAQMHEHTAKTLRALVNCTERSPRSDVHSPASKV